MVTLSRVQAGAPSGASQLEERPPAQGGTNRVTERGIDVLVALEDAVLAARVVRMLRTDPRVASVVAAASLGLGALLARSGPPHVAVLEFAGDLDRPRRAARLIAARDGFVAIVDPAPECLLAAAKSGATAVVGRAEASAHEIAGAIHRVAEGDAAIAPSVAAAALGALRGAPSRCDPASGPARLTPREADVMTLLVRGLTNTEIAAALGLRTKTVKNYMSGILAKLGVHHRGAAIAAWLDVQ